MVDISWVQPLLQGDLASSKGLQNHEVKFGFLVIYYTFDSL